MANGKPSTGLLFTNGKGGPVNGNSFAKYHIAAGQESVLQVVRPVCWSARHGTATALLNLTGDIRASYQVLGNTFEPLRL
jgi:hypothetical protein